MTCPPPIGKQVLATNAPQGFGLPDLLAPEVFDRLKLKLQVIRGRLVRVLQRGGEDGLADLEDLLE
jgi:hypothetical protein